MFASVVLSSAGVLNVTGDNAAANRLSITIDARGRLWGLANNVGASYTVGQVKSINLIGGSLADQITVGANVNLPVSVDAGAGNDVVVAGGGNATIFGGAGNDTITGSPVGDEIHGGDDDDNITGNGGNDTVFGDGGNDVITTGSGDDVIDGGAGTNTIGAGAGTNTVTNAGSTPGNTTTTPGGTGTTTGTLDAGINLVGGVLNVVGYANTTNDIQVWVSGDLTTSWITLNGVTKTIATSQYASVNVVKASDADKVVVDSRLGKPSTITTAGATPTPTTPPTVGTGSSGTVQTPADTSGSTLTSGINIVNGVLNVVGYANTTNDIQVWVSPDLLTSWITLNGSTKTIATGQYSSVSVVKAASTDSVVVDSRLGKASTVTTAGTTTTPPPTTGGTGSTGNTGGTTTPVDGTAPVAVITPISTSITAGQSVFVHALNSTLNGGDVLGAKYEWDFGDAGSKYNQLAGWNAGHYYANPGTYTVTLKLTNVAGKTTTVTQQISVAADTRRTIYVDSVNGNDANAGTSTSAAVKTAARAAALLTANAKVLFARGGTYAFDKTINTLDNTTFGAYGSGNSPLLLWTGPLQTGAAEFFAARSGQKNVVVQDLTFDTQNPADDGMPDGIGAGGQGITVLGNTFLNMGSAVNANGDPKGLLVQDNVSPLDTGLRGYMVWLQGSDSVIIGNTVANSTRQHDLRASYNFTRSLIAYNTFTNLDRRPLGDGQDYNKQTINLQWGSYIYVSHNTVKDGTIQVGPLGGADELQNYPDRALTERTSYVVLEANTVNNTNVQFRHGAENVSVRNNVVNYNDGAAFFVDGVDATYNRGVSNVSFVNNTAVNSGTQGNFIWVAGQSFGLTLDNNMYVAPNLIIGAYDTAVVRISYSDLSGFKEIKNNLWPLTPAPQRTWWANGGIAYVGTGAREGYLTETGWEALGTVQNDLFKNVTVSGSNYLFSTTAITYGADQTKVGL